MRYAQLSPNNTVQGISNLSGEVNAPHMILLAEGQSVAIGSTYDPDTGEFTPPPPPPPAPLTRAEWLALWTPEELVQWELFTEQETDPQIRAEAKVWEKWLQALDRYDLRSQRMQSFADWAVAQGLLTQARADEIMAGGG